MSDEPLDQEHEAADVNRVDEDVDGDEGGDELAPTATNVLDLLVTSLVDDADAVRIDATEQRGKVRLEVRVGPDEMGRVIGKRGRTANAIRTVVRAAAVRDDVHVDIEFED
ncbi:MAG: KH domain-containing protein [Acidimicrobiia bacterium]